MYAGERTERTAGGGGETCAFRGGKARRGATHAARAPSLDEGRDLLDGVLPDELSYETTVLSGTGLGRQCELADLPTELLGQLEGRLSVPRA
ncbi:hypothetical protein ACFYPC_01185 [Streptomyces sp. NPDC005808]|uniref:hypothetical protein n=1 Tax=Streptomyces sp. NPDC005808 TaxID=3364734 RepID=UPI0036794C1A